MIVNIIASYVIIGLMIMAKSPAVMMSDSCTVSSPIQCYSEVNKVPTTSQLVAVTCKIVKWEDEKSELVIAKVHPHCSHSKTKRPDSLHTYITK